MRLIVLLAGSLLFAGCSHATVSAPEQTTETLPPRVVHPPLQPVAPTETTPAKPTAAPASGARLAEVIAWIEVGKKADTAAYHRATADGKTNDLGDDVAFTVGSGSQRKTNCMTDFQRTDTGLACEVALTDPPARPADAYGNWRGGWIDFNGSTLQVGSSHGDPGRFLRGSGPVLPDGAMLAFGDYRCRAQGVDVYCVNYAHRSAAKLGPAGVEVFGCLRAVPPPADAGKLFSCAS